MPSDNANILLNNESGLDIPVGRKLLQTMAVRFSQEEKCRFSILEIVYVNEQEIVRINSEHLGRDYVTDIITFRYDEDTSNNSIEGTIFCCAPRITEQAAEYKQDILTEYLRIFIHGLLHLVGYEDQTPGQKKQMTAREDYYLQLMLDS